MSVSDCLVKGGIPDAWTIENLRWLAQAHRRVSNNQNSASHGIARAAWHRRWAAFCEDLLEAARVHDHRV